MTGLTYIPPMLPSLSDEPPEGDGCIDEIKRDGTELVLQGDHVRAFIRKGYD